MKIGDKEFEKLKARWYKKAEDSGFEDLEDEHGNLQSDGDRRTVGWDSREAIQSFFYALDSYLTNHDDIPARDRSILELYSQGVHIIGSKGIVEQTGVSDRTIRRVIDKYKKEVGVK